MEPQFFKNKGELRKWFENNHDSIDVLWVGYYKKSTRKESITWDQSVEVAICFGWIDGIRKSIDDQCYKIRFTPRNPRSSWSHKNTKTAEEMIKKGRMLAPGMKAFEHRREDTTGIYSYEQEMVDFNKEFETTFRKNQKAWLFFNSQPAYYRKITIRWVMSAKQDKTRRNRLETLISDSENQLKIKPLRRNND
jgi:uncharacterized protein YdeI (YjbR/CyaY-like superfamily)